MFHSRNKTTNQIEIFNLKRISSWKTIESEIFLTKFDLLNSEINAHLNSFIVVRIVFTAQQMKLIFQSKFAFVFRKKVSDHPLFVFTRP